MIYRKPVKNFFAGIKIAKKIFSVFIVCMKVKGVNFSPKYTTGSVDTRRKTAGRICAEVYSDLIKNLIPSLEAKGGHIEKRGIPFLQIEQLIKENLPERINFYIARNKPSTLYDGCIKTIGDRNFVKTYRMELPLVDKKLNIEKISTLMHEVRHLLDFAINPQYRVLVEKLRRNGECSDVLKFYKDFYYTKKNISDNVIKKNTLKFLKNYTPDESLIILRYIKSLLMSENDAYREGKTYGKKVSQRYCFLARYDYEEYRFKDKIELVDKLRNKLIQKERSKNKNRIFLNKIKKYFA